MLIDLGYVDEDNFFNILFWQFEVLFVQFWYYQFDNEQVKKLLEVMVWCFCSIVLVEQNGELLVGMVDFLDIFVYDELVWILKQLIWQVVVWESELFNILDLVYCCIDEIVFLVEELEDELGDDVFDLVDFLVEFESIEVLVVKLLQILFEDVVQV